jgi:hypothetical protein
MRIFPELRMSVNAVLLLRPITICTKGNGGEDTETSTNGLLREISGKLYRLEGIEKKLDPALRRD